MHAAPHELPSVRPTHPPGTPPNWPRTLERANFNTRTAVTPSIRLDLIQKLRIIRRHYYTRSTRSKRVWRNRRAIKRALVTHCWLGFLFWLLLINYHYECRAAPTLSDTLMPCQSTFIYIVFSQRVRAPAATNTPACQLI